MDGGYYEAQLSFTHPAASRRFRQHEVYALDAELVAALEPQITRGWLLPVPAHEAEGYRRLDPNRSGGTAEPEGDDDVPPSLGDAPAKDPSAQDPEGQGDGAATFGEAPTPPASTARGTSASSPESDG